MLEGDPDVPDAFVAFYEDHYDLVLATAKQRLRGISDAENVAADAFRLAWARYRKSGKITRPWVYSTLRNLVGNEYRRHTSSRRAMLVGAVASGPGTRDPDREDAVLVRQALARLGRADRELVFMAYWLDLGSAEMAEILGCSAGAVRVRLLRARNRLKEQLVCMAGDEFGGGEQHG